jgi:signal transduction histidine kinase
MLVLGLVDHWNVWLSPAPEAYHRFYFTPLIVLFFIVAIALLMMQQFHRAIRTDVRYRASLEREVAQQRAALQAQHEREQVHTRKEAVQTERERIVRDMHDGLGAQLVGLLSSVRHAPEAAQRLEPEIQLALEQLRATMDSLTSTETDLGTVLAQFRFHHEARLRRSGIQLRWRVSPLPLPPWEPAALWHMELMLREVFANSLKHAQAQHLTVSAGCDAQGQCHLSIEDDGVGFDPHHIANGRGLRHLQERTQMLGLMLHIDSDIGKGTRILWNWSQNWVPSTTSPT